MKPIDARKYSWVDSEILGTPSNFDSPASVREPNIKIGHPSNWLVLLMESGKRTCSSFVGAPFLSMNVCLLS